jgi:Tol biopolymer transport system component
MYLNAHAGGAPHIWRQRFPNGEPKQITSGPMEEEGIAIAPDGRSLITSAGFRKTAVWIHDAGGERQISLEGYAFQPKFTADGRKLCYRVLKGGYSYANPSELWIADLDSGRSRQLMPGLPVYGYFGYDISPDGTLVVGESRDPHGKPRLWIAPIDRRSPPEQIQNIEGRTPLFGPKGEIFFNLDDRSTGQLRVFPCEISRDGTGFRKVSEQPIAGLRSVSPDGRWLIAFTNGGTMALPVQGGTPVRIWGEDARVKWAPNGKAVFLSPGNVGAPSSGIERKTYALPLLPDQVLPMGASGSFRSQKELAAFRGVKVLDSPDAAPGLTPEVYAFVRETMQRNLYRVPLR